MTLDMYGHISYVGHAALINLIYNVTFSVSVYGSLFYGVALNIIEY